MAVLEIRQYPDTVLKARSKPVGDITTELQTLIDDMIETMYAAPGVGLAAPQVGVSLRLAVIDTSVGEDEGALMVLINPEVLYAEGEIEDEEGCLSIPGYNANVRRFAEVKVRALDRDGQPFEVFGDDLLSRALQHEIDHLDGILFIDHISPLKRQLFKRRVKKAMKNEGVGVS